MDYNKLANLLFPNTTQTIEELEKQFPKRELPENAMVTRLGPSPTGFIHLGNLYGAFVDERLAHQSDGLMLLRIEDTDAKRKVEGSEEVIINGLSYFGITFDEGETLEGEVGNYGPYHQSNRTTYYHVVAKMLTEKGLAYPSFVTSEELDAIREQQVKEKVITGYYGRWATDRILTYDEIETRIKQGMPWVLRLKSQGENKESYSFNDAIRGELTIHPNNMDIVLLKADGVPTYHFAHVVDDHLMRVTHVVRGEEWLSTLPIHLELFNLIGWNPPIYCHTAHLMKIDNGVKRKLSKRLDPELSLEYYMEQGYFPEAMREYLMTLMNSDYEEWRIENPLAPMDDFTFTLDKMGHSGALFDMDKLNDISKTVLLNLSEQAILDFLIEWSKTYLTSHTDLYIKHYDDLIKLLAIGRSDQQPRKDLLYADQIAKFIDYYFDEHYSIKEELPERVSKEDALEILKKYRDEYDYSLENPEWFAWMKELGESYGYTPKMKLFRKQPELFKGTVADVSTIIRLAMTGYQKSTDLHSIQQVFGKEKVLARINALINHLQ
ncbi:MAG: glutamate--tRNA ligase [Erysipelothrix sp.]|nr:glutamate--tRNA ligase [Erysipelothrix sp.]